MRSDLKPLTDIDLSMISSLRRYSYARLYEVDHFTALRDSDELLKMIAYVKIGAYEVLPTT